MSSLTIRDSGAQRLVAGATAATVALMAVAALRYGPGAMALPLVGVAALALLQWPRVAVGLVVALMVVCEGRGDDLVGFANFVYDPLPLGPTPMECLLALAVLAVLTARLRDERPLRLAGPLTVPLLLVVLATAAS